jgi:hypothetical protein
MFDISRTRLDLLDDDSQMMCLKTGGYKEVRGKLMEAFGNGLECM